MNKKIFSLAFFLGMLGTMLFVAQPVSAKTLGEEKENLMVETVIYNEEDSTLEVPNRGVCEFIPGTVDNIGSGIGINGTSKPSSTWDLSSQGRYDFSGGTSYNDLYSNYLFKGVSDIKVKLHATKYKSLNAELWKRNTGLFQSDQKVYTFDTLNVGQSVETTIFGLNSGSKYYLKFIAPAYFTGWIQQN